MKTISWMTVLIVLTLSGLPIHAAEGDASSDIATLDIQETYTLPISEISGLAWRKNPASGTRELLLVSDREFKLYSIDWSTRRSHFKLNSVDLGFLNSSQQKQSQWESVHSDASGRVYILQETPARILVLSSDLSSLETSITLENSDIPPYSNTAGEGLLTLAGHHAWVINEKEPLAIFEYGPATHKALGYHVVSQAVSSQTNHTKKSIYTALHRWSFDKTSRYMLEDASSLAQDDKFLYVLSDQKRTIGLLGKSLDTSISTLSVKRYWLLPQSIVQPEGLVFDPDNRPVIAIDRKNKKKKRKKDGNNKPNLFVLSPLY